jgi:hypothetical protein
MQEDISFQLVVAMMKGKGKCVRLTGKTPSDWRDSIICEIEAVSIDVGMEKPGGREMPEGKDRSWAVLETPRSGTKTNLKAKKKG